MKSHATHLSVSLTLTALEGIPLVNPGDDLSALILHSLEQTKLKLEDGDILIIAQKIISKSEGRFVRLNEVIPSEQALELAKTTGKDPCLVELILSESHKVVRYGHGVIVTENHQGVVLANGGIDQSNVDSVGGTEQVLLLPKNPDASAASIQKELEQKFKVNVAVIINDSIGRAWRNGTIGTALGVSGLPALLDLRGQPDLFGKPLLVSQQAVADELSSAASLLQGQAGEGLPVVLIRGYKISASAGSDMVDSGASALIRPREKDLIR
jgi:coenzyme F420-0:L-glutamate ligase/coenzyme F420-1:gamma-L-glutamate ligase